MKLIAFGLLCVVSAALAASTRDADACSSDVCIASSCYCSEMDSPLTVEETPQFVVLTFTDAVTQIIYSTYLLPILEGRTNPDGKQVGATFFVPHEYTDYEAVNSLYNLGLDIAVHSISKNALSSYWSDATVDTLVDEFYGQRQIISNCANIPIEDIIGARVPNLELPGDNLFEAYQESGIEYDNTWTALNYNKYFPYTLDYLSTQPCVIGSCPTESYPGIWEMPIINLVGLDNIQCNSIQGCSISGDAANVSAWLIEQFEETYQDNRAPITLTITSAWFATGEGNYDGFIQFLDYLQNYDDVYLVSHKQVKDWMQNPVSSSSYETDIETRSQSCAGITCELMKEEEYRYMKTCTTQCPAEYPWVGNPLGTASETL